MTVRVNLCRFAEYLYTGATVWLPRNSAVLEETVKRK